MVISGIEQSRRDIITPLFFPLPFLMLATGGVLAPASYRCIDTRRVEIKGRYLRWP